MPLHRAARIILELTDPKYKYIARNRDQSLCVFVEPPIKTETAWVSANEALELIDCNQFTMIQWTDDKPTLIEDLYE
jgi:hypothetical protein